MSYVGDIGTKIEFDINIEPSDILSATIAYIKPDGTRGNWVATVDIDEANIYYITQEGDFNVAGVYKLQPYVETSQWTGRGDVVSLEVDAIL